MIERGRMALAIAAVCIACCVVLAISLALNIRGDYFVVLILIPLLYLIDSFISLMLAGIVPLLAVTGISVKMLADAVKKFDLPRVIASILALAILLFMVPVAIQLVWHVLVTYGGSPGGGLVAYAIGAFALLDIVVRAGITLFRPLPSEEMLDALLRVLVAIGLVVVFFLVAIFTLPDLRLPAIAWYLAAAYAIPRIPEKESWGAPRRTKRRTLG